MTNALHRFLDTTADRIERADALDGVAEAVAGIADTALSPSRLTDLLSGTPIGHPLHPLLVTVPIGAWTSSLLLDVLGRDDAADILIALGVVSAVPTAAAGLSDWRHTTGAERRVGLVHALANGVALTAYTASWVARRTGHRTTGVVLSLAGATAVGVGGWLGGHLSYALGVGVDTTAFQHIATDWTDVCAEQDVAAGELTGAELDGVPVLVTRREGSVVVLADRCTHRGAPLHEGTLADGCVVCPWHDSVFALDGAVVRGPATRPQTVYEVRLQGGRVLARHADQPRSLRSNPVGI